MRSYLALIWNANDEKQREAAARAKARIRQCLRDWSALMDGPGMFVSLSPAAAHDSSTVYAVTQGRGVILGRLFRGTSDEVGSYAIQKPALVHFDDRLSDQVISDPGHTLGNRLWGAYVAFLRDEHTDRKWVLRSPMGNVPCQFADREGVRFYFVNIENMETIDKARLSINGHFLAGWFVAPNIHSGETALEGVSTVLPGELVEHRADEAHRRFFWDAICLARSEVEMAISDAKVETGRIVRSCIHAWASCFDKIFLQLSGGLDSTIIAACLANAPTRPEVTCAHFYSTSETSEERQYAREVADRYGFELIEVSDDDLDVIRLQPQRRSVVPLPIVSRDHVWRELFESLARRGSMIHIRGDGGDELFCRGDECLPDAIGQAYRFGLTPKLWGVAMNDALIARNSVWENLALAVRHGLLKRPYDWRGITSHFAGAELLSPGVAATALNDRTHWHPRYRSDLHCHPAKILQAHSILQYTNHFYFEPVANQLDVIAPLLSQPHVEFALQAPFHVLRSGGRDRAMARAAFEKEIPSNIVHRKFKALCGDKSGDWAAANMARVRELLLEGHLGREKIINRSLVERFLANASSRSISESPDVMRMLSVEVWALGVNAGAEMAA